ncbi:hypothetical protein [Fortiea contorta]|nr:hypothetical protein [Fortiea contorta]
MNQQLVKYRKETVLHRFDEKHQCVYVSEQSDRGIVNGRLKV